MEEEFKLNRILFTTKFYCLYFSISFLLPLISAFLGHYEVFNFKFPYLIVLSTCYSVYAFFGIFFKGCIYDLNEENKTSKNITLKIIYLVLIVTKVFANSLFSFWFCKVNKTGVIFISCIFAIYLIHILTKVLVRFSKIIPLKTYWISYIFYQLTRLCISLFFIISIIFEFNHVETYYYAGTLFIILIYMYMVDHFNILMKDLVYNSYIHAIFNYPMEWMNLLCCWFITPIECIRNCDLNYFYALLFILLFVMGIILILVLIALLIACIGIFFVIGVIYLLYLIVESVCSGLCDSKKKIVENKNNNNNKSLIT